LILRGVDEQQGPRRGEPPVARRRVDPCGRTSRDKHITAPVNGHMNGMIVCCCNLTMAMCKCEMTDKGCAITCTSGDKDCCAMIQACCDCCTAMMKAGCTCCVMMNGMPVCCGC
jgi:hypothetical protein